jgi:hypothetical protein
VVSLSVIVPATNNPATLQRCLDAIGLAESPPEQLIVVREAAAAGPAAARNSGARDASGDVLVFIDADIEVHPDAFQRIRRAFSTDPELVALFGSYDDEPASPGIVSSFRNLLHHHVHQMSAGAATTFWAGIGAVRRDSFQGIGGFDQIRFAVPSVEDIELGMRLTAAGAPIVLDPTVQGKHLKHWTFANMVQTDLRHRGIPWVRLLLESRQTSATLNLGWRHRLSSLAVLFALGGAAARRPGLAATSVAGFIALNRSFYALLFKRSGRLAAVAGVGLHAVHHLTGVAAVPAGLVRHLARRTTRSRSAGRSGGK